jgi:dipeptidyl aminopeptidase/acylaminoacyl peptidase
MLFACLATYGLLAHTAPKVPLSAFVQEDTYSRPHLSPDGKYIALTVRAPDGAGKYAHMVTIYALPEMKVAGTLRMPKFQEPLGYIWAGKTRLVIVKGLERGNPDEPDGAGEAVATEVDASKQVYVYGPRLATAARRGERYGNDYTNAYMQELLHASNNHFLLATQPDDAQRTFLFDVDSVGGTRTRLADAPAKNLRFLMQQNGKPLLAFGVDEQKQPLVYRYNELSGSWGKPNGNFGKYYRPLGLATDGGEYTAMYSADGGPVQLIRENLATGVRTTLLADPRANVESVMRGGYADLPFGASSGIGIPTLQYFEGGSEDARQLYQLLSAQFPGSYVDFVGFARDGKTLLFKVASDRQPGEYYVLYRDTMKADLLFSVRDATAPEDMAERRPIAFKARDGLDLHGYLTLPQRASGAKRPMVVLPHDGPHDKSDSWFFDRDAQFLASRGYAVLQVNFRGSAGRGINFEESGYRQWGAKMQDDLADGIKVAIAQGDVDGGRICAYGVGFGGYSALMLAAREPALIKCAVGQGGFYDLNLLYKTDDKRRAESTEKSYRKMIGRDKAELARFSPITHVASITAPVLLVHGEQDATAPIEHATAMRAALVKAEQEPEWLVAPNEGHRFYDPANVALFYQKLETFLDKHIGK